MPNADSTEDAQLDPVKLVTAGRKLIRKRKFADGEQYFRKALELNPHEVAAHEALATSAFLQKDFEQAAEHFREASRCDSRRAEPLINLGAVLNKLKNHKAAIDALQKSLARDRANADAYYNLGIAYRGVGQSGMAVSAYKEAIRLKFDFAEAHQNLGNAYLDQKNVRQATASFQRALDINPDLPGAKRGLQRTNAETSDNASQAAKRSDGSNPSDRSISSIALTEIQRSADREIVCESTKRIERTILAWATEVKSQLEPSVKGMHRAIINSDTGDGASKLVIQLSTSLRSVDDLTRLLSEARVLLEEHERDIAELSAKAQ